MFFLNTYPCIGFDRKPARIDMSQPGWTFSEDEMNAFVSDEGIKSKELLQPGLRKVEPVKAIFSG